MTLPERSQLPVLRGIPSLSPCTTSPLGRGVGGQFCDGRRRRGVRGAGGGRAGGAARLAAGSATTRTTAAPSAARGRPARRGPAAGAGPDRVPTPASNRPSDAPSPMRNPHRPTRTASATPPPPLTERNYHIQLACIFTSYLYFRLKKLILMITMNPCGPR